MKTSLWIAAASVAALTFGANGPARADEVLVGLITKTNNNPFFAKMKVGRRGKGEGARRQVPDHLPASMMATTMARSPRSKSLISAGAKGILITPSDTKAIVPTVKKARDAGILVIALDTPLEPIDAADATFATDNFKAGELIGEWAAKTLGDKAKDAKIAFLDALEFQPTVDACAIRAS